MTRSKVAIVANSRGMLDSRLGAISDRGHIVFFEPEPLEVHRRVAGWFWEQENFAFIGERLQLFSGLSMRLYVKAAEAKAAGLDWHAAVISACLAGHALVVQLRSDPKNAHEEDRVREFIARTGASRATFFIY